MIRVLQSHGRYTDKGKSSTDMVSTKGKSEKLDSIRTENDSVMQFPVVEYVLLLMLCLIIYSFFQYRCVVSKPMVMLYEDVIDDITQGNPKQ